MAEFKVVGTSATVAPAGVEEIIIVEEKERAVRMLYDLGLPEVAKIVAEAGRPLDRIIDHPDPGMKEKFPRMKLY